VDRATSPRPQNASFDAATGDWIDLYIDAEEVIVKEDAARCAQ